MTSKEALEKICKDWGCSMAHAYKRCPWRGIPGEYCEEYETIKKDLEVLKKHYQIEKELGIDLVTLFKALKQGGVYVKAGNKSDWEIPMSGFQICGDKLNGISFWSQLRLNAKDYGKTWALTKKELER